MLYGLSTSTHHKPLRITHTRISMPSHSNRRQSCNTLNGWKEFMAVAMTQSRHSCHNSSSSEPAHLICDLSSTFTTRPFSHAHRMKPHWYSWMQKQCWWYFLWWVRQTTAHSMNIHNETTQLRSLHQSLPLSAYQQPMCLYTTQTHVAAARPTLRSAVTLRSR